MPLLGTNANSTGVFEVGTGVNDMRQQEGELWRYGNNPCVLAVSCDEVCLS